ncbi:MAG TPA: MMPL family transporter, partial [Pseudonocardiaceae bacterium]
MGVGNIVTRRSRLILVVAAIAVVAAAGIGFGAPGKLRGGGFTDPNSPSELARTQLDAGRAGQPNLAFLVTAKTGTVDSAAVAVAGRTLTQQLVSQPDISSVTSYWSTGSPSLKSRDGTQALVLTHVRGNDQAITDRAKTLINAFSTPGGSTAGAPGPITVKAGGQAGASHDITNQITKDLALAEGIAIPVTLLLLLVAFATAVAALLPIAIGVVAIFGTLAVLFVLGSVTDVSIYALNLTTAMGLGLAIDYALLMVSRYREQLAAGDDPAQAVRRSVQTAGRTIIFSAAAVAAALAALLVFPVYFLRSFAYAGISVVVVAAVAATVVLPAALTVLGPRVNAGKIRSRARGLTGAESPFWRQVATRVWRRPVLIGLPVVALLLVLGAPFLRVHFGTPDDRVLSTSAPARQVGDALRTNFTVNDTNTLEVVSTSPLTAAGTTAYGLQLSRLSGVARVDGPTGTYSHGTQVSGPGPASAGHALPGGTWLSAVSTLDPESGAAQTLVHQARALPAPGGVHTNIGGQSASLVDQKHAIGSKLVLAGSLIALTTFIVLFLFTGSVVLPLKALVLNALSLTAVFGVLVWIFQEGHLSGLLGFTPLPTSTTMPPLLFCITFGLSMDYEVFVLSRIKELHDAGYGNDEAVVHGLARTGRIITTAAVLLAVTFFAFGLSKVSFIQMFGIGCGLAILIDATLIRGVLVPAFMRLAGRANWYAPGPMRRFHDRFGLGEAPVDRPGPA